MSRRITVVAGIFIAERRVFACRRASGLTAGGRWEFPGGKVEDGETPHQALRRELREELAVTVHVGDLLDRTTTVVDDTAIDLACYRIAASDPQPKTSTDHDRVAWLGATELGRVTWAEPDLPVVRKLPGILRT